MRKGFLRFCFAFCFVFIWSGAWADNGDQNLNLQTLLVKVLKNHEEIKSLQSQVKQAQEQYLQVRRTYYPALDLTADTGQEKIEKEFGLDTNETRYQLNLTANQLITDFGKTKHNSDRSEIVLQQTQASLESTRQRLLLEGITAYINVVKARNRLESARKSESRIKELTGIEESLVSKGAGLSSDVLQAQSQLSGAKALRVESEGELNIAKNRFRAVFYHSLTGKEIAGLQDIKFPDRTLPSSLEEAVQTAFEKNPELVITEYNTKIAQKDIKIAKTAFYPRLGLFGSALTKDNDAGVLGWQHEFSAGVDLSYNIFRGGGDRAALRAAVESEKVALHNSDNARKIIMEQVSNSWDQLINLRLRAQLLEEQAEIVRNFLELAKKERKMGTRSLLDVLNGEINYINATATSIAARQDTKIAAYNLIYTMGLINLELFQSGS